MTNNPPNPEEGGRPNPGLGMSTEPLNRNTTGLHHPNSGPTPPPYAPSSYAGAPSGFGPVHTGSSATSDQYPTAVEHLVSPAAGGSSHQYHSSPANYSVPGGTPGASDYSSSSQYPPDKKSDSFSPQPGYSSPAYNPQGYSQPGYNTGSHDQSVISSPPPPVDQKASPPYTASSNPGFFSPDTVGNSQSSPSYTPSANPAFYSPDTVGNSHPGPAPANQAFFSPDQVGNAHSSPSPAYTGPLIVRPIVIPQVNLQPTAPLLQAYPPQLLARGIPRDRWLAFISHLSAILGATDAENSKAHRADISKELGNIPASFGKSVADHATQIGRGLKKDARKGNLLGVSVGAIGGVIAWPVVTSLKVVGTVVTSPISIMQAVAKKPQKRHERAAVAAAEASKGWLHERGYHASMMSTEELASVTGIEARRFVDAGHGGPADAADKMGLMVERLELAQVEVQKGLGGLEVGSSTLWLVLVPYAPDNVSG